MKTFGSATCLYVSNLDASLKSYTEVLGFTERFRHKDYAGVEHGEVQIHLAGPAVPARRQIGEGSLYVFCDDVDAYYTEITAKGAKVPEPPKDCAYGMRDFAVTDLDGNRIAFGRECKSAPESTQHS